MIASSPILLGFVGMLFTVKLALLAVAAVLIARSLSARFGSGKPALIPAPIPVSRRTARHH